MSDFFFFTQVRVDNLVYLVIYLSTTRLCKQPLSVSQTFVAASVISAQIPFLQMHKQID